MDVLVPAVKIVKVVVPINVRVFAEVDVRALVVQNVKVVVIHVGQLALVVKDAVVVTHHVGTDVELVVPQGAVQHALVAVLIHAWAALIHVVQPVQIIAMVVAMVLVELNALVPVMQQ
jgi:hypothetical protein